MSQTVAHYPVEKDAKSMIVWSRTASPRAEIALRDLFSGVNGIIYHEVLIVGTSRHNLRTQLENPLMSN
jgi:hypothetical protein